MYRRESLFGPRFGHHLTNIARYSMIPDKNKYGIIEVFFLLRSFNEFPERIISVTKRIEFFQLILITRLIVESKMI